MKKNIVVEVEVPEGATHYEMGDYWKLESGKWYFWNSYHDFWNPVKTQDVDCVVPIKEVEE